MTEPEARRFVSLFEGATDVWAEEDFRMVEELSSIARWSRPDKFERLLSEATQQQRYPKSPHPITTVPRVAPAVLGAPAPSYTEFQRILVWI
ncbi:MAG: hypothetical protein ACFCVA_14030 [Gammaproteobacteria bacterium]